MKPTDDIAHRISDPSDLAGKAVVAAWPLFGYAPGQYTFKCLECGKSSIKDGSSFGDKRAIMCLECAVIKAKEQIDRLTRDLAEARDKALEEAAKVADEAASQTAIMCHQEVERALAAEALAAAIRKLKGDADA